MPTTQRAITIVLGMHRSGTSLASHLLSLLGRDMADEITVHDSNAHGHWERWELVGFHDRVLAAVGRGYFEPNHAQPLPMGWWADPAVRRIRDEMTAWLKERMGTSTRFGFKDPRTTRLLPMWREVFAELALAPRFIFCLRHPGAVASSLAARDGMAPPDGERLWLAYNVEAVNGIGGDAVAILPYERWFSDPRANLRAIAGLVGGFDIDEWRLESILDHVVDTSLRHHDAPAVRACAPACWLHRQLLAAAPGGVFGADLRTAAAALDRFATVMMPLEAERDALRTLVGGLQAELAEARLRIAALEEGGAAHAIAEAPPAAPPAEPQEAPASAAA